VLHKAPESTRPCQVLLSLNHTEWACHFTTTANLTSCATSGGARWVTLVKDPEVQPASPCEGGFEHRARAMNLEERSDRKYSCGIRKTADAIIRSPSLPSRAKPRRRRSSPKAWASSRPATMSGRPPRPRCLVRDAPPPQLTHHARLYSSLYPPRYSNAVRWPRSEGAATEGRAARSVQELLLGHGRVQGSFLHVARRHGQVLLEGDRGVRAGARSERGQPAFTQRMGPASFHVFTWLELGVSLDSF
jgi:hypothetical protein